jgi:hypothetical protein
LESKTVFGQSVQSVLSVIAPLPLISFIESPVGASRFVYSRCFAHDFPERGPSLFDPAQIARSQS